MTTTLMLLAVLPAIILISMVYKADKLEKEPKNLMVKLIFLGIVSTVPAIAMEVIGEIFLMIFVPEDNLVYTFIHCFFIIGIAEESSKFLMVKLGSYKDTAYDCLFDGIVYAVTVSLGFALFENILYVFEGGITTALLRAFTSIPGHATFGVFMGIWYGKAKHMNIIGNKEQENKNIFLSILVPAIIHGLYDFILMSNPQTILGKLVMIVCFIIFVIILFTITAITTKSIAKRISKRYTKTSC